MDRRLVDVSQAGNLKALYALLEDEPRILDFVDDTQLTRTPLHLAILAQKPHFAMEIAKLRPSFITKIDSFGYSPLHLAAEKGQVDILRGLLEISLDSRNIASIRGKENKTPLHFAVISGKVEVVNFLLNSYPHCVSDSTARNETALHLAVKNHQLGVFLFLLQWLKVAYLAQGGARRVPLLRAVGSPCFDDCKVIIDLGGINGFLNLRDEDGNNILHLATITKQQQMIEGLLSFCRDSNGGIQVDEKAMING